MPIRHLLILVLLFVLSTCLGAGAARLLNVSTVSWSGVVVALTLLTVLGLSYLSARALIERTYSKLSETLGGSLISGRTFHTPALYFELGGTPCELSCSFGRGNVPCLTFVAARVENKADLHVRVGPRDRFAAGLEKGPPQRPETETGDVEFDAFFMVESSAEASRRLFSPDAIFSIKKLMTAVNEIKLDKNRFSMSVSGISLSTERYGDLIEAFAICLKNLTLLNDTPLARRQAHRG